jgi:hypothetical protein
MCDHLPTFMQLYEKAKFPLSLINQAPRPEDVWGSVGIVPPLLTSALDGVSGLLHAPAALPPVK